MTNGVTIVCILPSLISLVVSVDVKHHVYLLRSTKDRLGSLRVERAKKAKRKRALFSKTYDTAGVTCNL